MVTLKQCICVRCGNPLTQRPINDTQGNQVVVSMSCGHLYHAECYLNIFRINNRLPESPRPSPCSVPRCGDLELGSQLIVNLNVTDFEVETNVANLQTRIREIMHENSLPRQQLKNTNAELNETSFAAQAATTRLIRANAAADSWHKDFNTLSRFPDIVQGAPSSLGANSATPDAIVPLTSQQQMRLTVRRDTQPPPGIQPFSREDGRVLSTDPREPDLKRARSSEYKRKPSGALIPPPRLETIREEDSCDIEPPYNRTSMADRLRTVQLSMQQEQAQSSAHENVVQMETEDISTSGMVTSGATSGATSAATASGPSYMGATADQRSQDPAVRLPPGLYPTQHLPIVRTTTGGKCKRINIKQQWYPLRQPPAGALPAPVAVRFPTPVTSQAYVSQFTTPPVTVTQASTTRGKYTTIRPPAQPMATVTGAPHIPPFTRTESGVSPLVCSKLRQKIRRYRSRDVISGVCR
ncbi:hypothetical protein U1Q18_049869 [Sarracenia purpurea var. burkii]